jgi:hypothetical protein
MRPLTPGRIATRDRHRHQDASSSALRSRSATGCPTPVESTARRHRPPKLGILPIRDHHQVPGPYYLHPLHHRHSREILSPPQIQNGVLISHRLPPLTASIGRIAGNKSSLIRAASSTSSSDTAENPCAVASHRRRVNRPAPTWPAPSLQIPASPALHPHRSRQPTEPPADEPLAAIEEAVSRSSRSPQNRC